MKPIVFFILGVLTVLALGAFQAPEKPPRYEVVEGTQAIAVRNELNRLATEGCRLQTAFGLQTSVASAAMVVIMECPGE